MQPASSPRALSQAPNDPEAGSLFARRDPSEFPFTPSEVSVLLGRPRQVIPTDLGRSVLDGARVLVTGAGGSVGIPLVRALVAHGAARVVALDNHEATLFELGRAVGPDAPVELRLGDVRHADKLRRTFAEARPDVVFHLAAYKHVPFGELEPDEPVSVNVLGTESVVGAALESGVAHLVYPSSDKAVNPPSVYGATKRLAEALCLNHARGQAATSVHVCRYVNIVGSRGSVLETFLRQAREGSALTLTDRRMTRYWMTMDEAIDLLWHALGLESGSHTLLDTGEPIPVESLARRLFGLVHGDGAEPEWRVLGSRPGERLAEELVSASEFLAPCDAGAALRIIREGPVVSAETLAGMVDELRHVIARGAPEPIRDAVMGMAKSLQ